MDSGFWSGIWDIWGSSASDIYAVGSEGTILHYDGINWSRTSTGLGARLIDVWGTSPEDVYVVGDHGTILHYNGHQWMPMDTPLRVEVSTVGDFTGIWGSLPSDIYAVAYVGPYISIPENPVSPWAWSSPIWHYDGNSWSEIDCGTTTKSLSGVWGSGNQVFAVGDYGTVFQLAA